jgi:hypothetical protein
MPPQPGGDHNENDHNHNKNDLPFPFPVPDTTGERCRVEIGEAPLYALCCFTPDSGYDDHIGNTCYPGELCSSLFYLFPVRSFTLFCLPWSSLNLVSSPFKALKPAISRSYSHSYLLLPSQFSCRSQPQLSQMIQSPSSYLKPFISHTSSLSSSVKFVEGYGKICDRERCCQRVQNDQDFVGFPSIFLPPLSSLVRASRFNSDDN